MKKTLITCAIVLFLCSCSNAPYCNNIRQYSPNLIDMEEYEAILCSSPIPIYVMPMDEYVSKYLYKVSIFFSGAIMAEEPFWTTKILLGHTVVDQQFVQSWPKDFIFINSLLNNDQLISTYYHELGHYKCWKKKCSCLQEGLSSEYHAFISEIEMSIKMDTPKALISSLTIFEFYTIHESGQYSKASKKILKSKYWNKIERYFKDKGITNYPMKIKFGGK